MQKANILGSWKYAVLEARCPECGRKAQVDDEMENVKCPHCGFSAKYDDYIEIMKGKAVMMSDDFQNSWDKNPF
jgi:hypothetical protein